MQFTKHTNQYIIVEANKSVHHACKWYHFLTTILCILFTVPIRIFRLCIMRVCVQHIFNEIARIWGGGACEGKGMAEVPTHGSLGYGGTPIVV